VERRDLFRGTLATGLFAVPQLPAKTASAADIVIERHDRLSRQSVRDDGFESHSLLNSLNSIGLGDDESRRLGIAQGGEHGRGRKESREFVDERDHSAMPKAVEAKEVHFFDGLLGRPLLRGAAVGRDENAGAVFA
jgi:hypothetical protein